MLDSPLHICVALLAAWMVIGMAGLIRPRSLEFAGRALFVLGREFLTTTFEEETKDEWFS